MAAKRVCGLVILFFVGVGLLAQNKWYISPDGDVGSAGTIDDPFGLKHIMSNDVLFSGGDTLLLRGGVYLGEFRFVWKGSLGNPIVVMPYEYEAVILMTNGGSGIGVIHDFGAYVEYRDLFITSNNLPRISEETGSSPTDISEIQGVYCEAEGSRYINNIIFDVPGNGVGSWAKGEGGLLYGNLIFNNGWFGPDRGHGHGLYLQNSSGGLYKNVENNVFFNNHAYNFKAYGESGKMHNVSFIDNICFNAGYPAHYYGYNCEVGGFGGPPTNISFIRNYAYSDSNVRGGGIRIGYQGDGLNLTAQGNVTYGGGDEGTYSFIFSRWCSGSVTDNIIYTYPREYTTYGSAMMYYLSPDACSDDGITWAENTWYSHPSYPGNFVEANGTKGEWSYWNSIKPTWASKDIYVTASPSNNIINVIANEHETGRGHIVIYNNEGLNTVNVDISGLGLQSGDSVFVYDVENVLRDPVIASIYSGSVDIPMNLTQISPHGTYYNEIAHTESVFGAYLVMPRRLPKPCFVRGVKVVPSETDRFFSIDFSLEGECNAVTLDVKYESETKFTVSDYTANDEIDFYEKCSSCLQGTYIIDVMSGGNVIRDTIVYNPPPCHELTLNDYDFNGLDTLTLNICSYDTKEAVIRLFNDTELVKDSTFNLSGGEEVLEFYFKGINPGLYKVELDDGKTTINFSIEIKAKDKLYIIDYDPDLTIDTVSVEYYCPINGDIIINVKKMNGLQVGSYPVNSKVGNNTIVINLDEYKDAGLYTIILREDLTGSEDSCKVTKYNPLKIIDYSPNPTEDIVSISYYCPFKSEVAITVRNANGNLMGEMIDLAIEGDANKVDVSLADYPEGDYSVKLIDGTSNDSCIVTKLNTEPLYINNYSPNPTDDIVSISYYCPKVTNVDIIIKDTDGMIMDEYTEAAVEGDANQIDVTLGSYEAGEYTIILSEENSSDSCVVMKNNRLPISILDYSPNPTEDKVTITYYSPIVTEVGITVANANGDILATYTDSAIEGDDNQVDVSLGSYENGDYTITLSEENSSDFCVVTKSEILPISILDYSPNPTEDLVTISYYSPITIEVGITVANANGDVLASYTDSAIEGDGNQVGVSLGSYEAGDYTITLSEENSSDFCVVTRYVNNPTSGGLEITYYNSEVKDKLSIEYLSQTTTLVGLNIYDSNNNVEIETEDSAVEGSNKIELDLQELAPGEYSFKLFNDESEVVESFTKVSSDKPIEFKIISVDPDPTIDWVTITFTIDLEGMIEYEISGEDIVPISTNYPVGRGENKLPIDLRGEDFPAGEYTIVLKSGEKQISRTVIKQARY